MKRLRLAEGRRSKIKLYSKRHWLLASRCYLHQKGESIILYKEYPLFHHKCLPG